MREDHNDGRNVPATDTHFHYGSAGERERGITIMRNVNKSLARMCNRITQNMFLKSGVHKHLA